MPARLGQVLYWAAIVALGCALIGASFFIWYQSRQLSELKQTSAASLEKQKWCAERADLLANDVRQLYPATIHRSHYNPKFERCFVRLESVHNNGDGTEMERLQVLDAFEQRPYGLYVAIRPKEGAAAVKSCWYALQNVGSVDCGSRDEWQLLMTTYLGK